MAKTAKTSFNGIKAACDKKIRKEILAAFNDKEYGLAEITWKNDHADLLKRAVGALAEKVLVKHGLKLTGVRLGSMKNIRHYRDINADGILATVTTSDDSMLKIFIRTTTTCGYTKVASVGYLWDVQLLHDRTYAAAYNAYGADPKEAAQSARVTYCGPAEIKSARVYDAVHDGDFEAVVRL